MWQTDWLFYSIKNILTLSRFFSYQDSVIYRNGPDHEKKILSWELNYLLNLDSYWLNGNIWVISSFKRHGAFFRCYMLIYKLVLLLIFIFARSNLYQQGFLFWICFVFLFFQNCVLKWPYRCLSTNIMSFSCFSLLLVASSFGFANSCNVLSGITVPSVESLWWVFSVTFCRFVFVANAHVLNTLSDLCVQCNIYITHTNHIIHTYKTTL